jgi:hypothetical protein
MKKAKIIFGSGSELRAFDAIDKHLPAGWRLYANTPLPRIVEVERNELPEKKWNFYLKTSVDFVLTNLGHEPVLALEFDGIGHGYSAGTRYVIRREVEGDPYRELKVNFKIDTCYAVGLPLVVISFEEIETVTGDDVLALINSMIGAHIASHEYRETIEQWDREGRGKGKTFEEMLWDDSTLRSELQIKNDPFLSRLEAIWDEFENLGASWSCTSLSKPDVTTAMRERRSFDSVGCRYVVKGGKLPIPVIMTVWVRNFAGDEMGASLIPDLIPSHGINPLKVAENIAWYLSHKKAIEIAKRCSS